MLLFFYRSCNEERQNKSKKLLFHLCCCSFIAVVMRWGLATLSHKHTIAAPSVQNCPHFLTTKISFWFFLFSYFRWVSRQAPRSQALRIWSSLFIPFQHILVHKNHKGSELNCEINCLLMEMKKDFNNFSSERLHFYGWLFGTFPSHETDSGHLRKSVSWYFSWPAEDLALVFIILTAPKMFYIFLDEIILIAATSLSLRTFLENREL